MTPNEYHAELTNLHTALSNATPTTLKDIVDKAYDVMCNLETDYGVPAFNSEVHPDTIKMFFALQTKLDAL
jgi:hypothetical protein